MRKDGELYYCSVCGESYNRELYALSCEKGHDIVYVPIKREDLFRLIQFIYVKDDSLLTESLVKTLQKYRSQL